MSCKKKILLCLEVGDCLFFFQQKYSKELQDLKQEYLEETRKLRQECEDKDDKLKILSKNLLQNKEDK